MIYQYHNKVSKHTNEGFDTKQEGIDTMSKIYGYARISTKKQSMQRQIDNIKAYNESAIILEEAFTGTKVEGRKVFSNLLSKVEQGDTIIFDSVSRMSRNAEEGYKLYEELFNKGVNLVFLKEQHINTDTYKKALSNNVAMTGTNLDFLLEGINKYLMALAKEQIQIAFNQSEKEVTDLQQRTKEGIKAKRKQAIEEGREFKIGIEKGTKLVTKKSIQAKADIMKYSKEFNGTLKDTEVMKLVGLARNTYYKYKKELMMEHSN